MTSDILTSISESKAGAVLLAIRKAGGRETMNGLRPVMRNFQTLRERIRAMEADGLVDVTQEYSPRKITRVAITDVGDAVAKVLDEIDGMVGPDGVAMEDKVISKHYAEWVLRILLANGELMQKDLKRTVSNYDALMGMLEEMQALELVRMRENTQSYRTIYITLTPLGKKVARRYQKIYEMIAVDV